MIAESIRKNASSPLCNETMLTGKLEGKLVTVKTMLDKGMPVASVAQLLDLSCDQIRCVQLKFSSAH